MSRDPQTPVKIKTRGRKPQQQTVNDYCRLCSCNLRIELGSSRTSSENLFNRSERKESTGLILASALEGIGLRICRSPNYSERICRPCGRKIRNAVENYSFIRQRLQNENTSSENDNTICTTPERPKRQLPTTITPERGHSQKRKKEPLAERILDTENEEAKSVVSEEDFLFNLMNIENIPPEETTSHVRVFISYPNNTVIVKKSFDKETSSLIRNIAQKNWKAAANIVFKHTFMKEFVTSVLSGEISKEFHSLNVDSMLNGTSPEELACWSNKLFAYEVSVKCPLWFEVVNGACGKSSNNNRAENAMALSTSILARQRNPKLSALAYRISLLLFHSGASYSDIIRLNHLGVCMHPVMIQTLQRKMGSASDSKVLLWKKSIENNLSALMLLRELHQKQIPQLEDSDMNLVVNIDFSEENLKRYSTFTKGGYKLCLEHLESARKRRNETCITDEVLDEVIYSLEHQQLPLYKIVGDNIDYHVNARYQTKESTNKSIHWTQQYAILNRVNDPLLDNSQPQMKLKDVQLVNFLPTKSVHEIFKRNWAIIVSRVISKYIRIFQHMQDGVIWHISHSNSEKMSKKSDICCLGLQFKNPNVGGEMAQLLMQNQQSYVPCIKLNEEIQVLLSIPFHGDQLFEERARNAQGTFQDGSSKYERLEGFTTESADWHAKVNLYSIEFETFVKNTSSAEICTSRASMNRTAKTRAAQGVEKHFNEYKDFHQREVEAHICASFMEMLNMKNMSDEADLAIPTLEVPKQTRGRWFLKLCDEYVEKFLGCSEVLQVVEKVRDLQVSTQSDYKCRSDGCLSAFVYHSGRVRHEIEKHQLAVETCDKERDSFGYFFCRARCGLVYSTKTTRNRHECSQHPSFTIAEQIAEQPADTKEDDFVYNYHKGKLAFGLLIFDFEDAVKEGDGDRLYNIYKLALLFYKAHGHHKYAYVIFLYLVKVEAALSKMQANTLKYNRFYNKSGGKGRNISLDLKMEQLNKLLKTLWRGLGANLDEGNAARVANCIEGLEQIIESIDQDCLLSGRSGYHSKGKPEETVKQIVSDLIDKSVFQYTPKRRGYPSFPKFKSSLLQPLDYRDLHSWMAGLIKQWGVIYDTA